MRRGRRRVRPEDREVTAPTRGGRKLDEGDLLLARLRKMKRRLKLVLRGLEEWEREIVRVKRKDRQKANAGEIAILHEMYEETSRKADELERRAERLEKEPARRGRKRTTDDDLGI